MKKFILFITIIFVVGCGGGGGSAIPVTEKEVDRNIFEERFLDLKSVNDLQNILYTLLLKNTAETKRSLEISRAVTQKGDISGYYVKEESFDQDLNAYVGKITYVNYKNTNSDCPSLVDSLDISMSYIRYTNKVIYKILTDGTINNQIYYKNGEFTVNYLSQTHINTRYDINIKIDDIEYGLKNVVEDVVKGSDYNYVSYDVGKIYVKTSSTNGYFYIQDTNQSLKFDKCGKYIDGDIFFEGKNSLAELKIQNSKVTLQVTDYDNPSIDPLYEKQWSINPKSIYYAEGKVVKNADINVTEAWEKTYGEGVTVAVIDDCFDADHEDLYNNVYKTYNANDDSTNVAGSNCHGTSVVGVIGAEKNSKGIIGVAPKVKLILISINLENSTESDFVKAFEYAKDNGAKVINCSWGSNNESQAIADELQSIRQNGVITVFASGNSNQDLDQSGINDESEDPNVIGVGATEGETNDVTYYSNYGSNIDILAPGGSTDLGVLLLKDANNYGNAAGTSFASPCVAGVIALLLSQNQNLTFDDVYTKITQTADKVGTNNGANYVNGFDKYRAYGKINAGKVLE